jgi:heptosyltransferase-2
MNAASKSDRGGAPPPAGDSLLAALRPDRVLVKEVNWLGDLVMSRPALRAVRRAYPGAHLAILIRRELAGFFDASNWIDEVIPYGVAPGARGVIDRIRIVRELRARRFDLAVLFPNSFESALWATLAGIPHRAGFARDGRGLMLTRRSAPDGLLMQQHQVHYLMRMLRDTLGIEGDTGDCSPDVSPAHRSKMRLWLASHRRRPGAKLIALAPAAAYGPAKEWPAEYFGALIDLIARRHGAESVIVGAASEREKCEQAAAASAEGAVVAAGHTGVGEMVALMALCDGFAGNDSGSMHVAGALGIPTVGIYGSTRPWRTGPLGARTATVCHQLECSPCLQRTCRFGHYNCLRQITPEEIAAALDKLGAFAAASAS